VLDCDTGEDEGCSGGLPYGAYQYLIAAGGIESEVSYPYTGTVFLTVISCGHKDVFAQARTTSVEQRNLSLFLASRGVTLTLPLGPMVSRGWSIGCLMLPLLRSALTQAKM